MSFRRSVGTLEEIFFSDALGRAQRLLQEGFVRIRSELDFFQKGLALGSDASHQKAIAQIDHERIQPFLAEGTASHRGAEAGGARVVASEADKGGGLHALNPPGILVLGIVEIDLDQLEGESVTRSYSHDNLRGKVLGRLLDDMRVLFALVQSVFEHPL